MTDLFIERMTVLDGGLVFQPVLVTHTCTYCKRERERERERAQREHSTAQHSTAQHSREERENVSFWFLCFQTEKMFPHG